MLRRRAEIITGGDGITVTGQREKHPVVPGDVAILDDSGDLICICKDDKKLIQLAIYSHWESYCRL